MALTLLGISEILLSQFGVAHMRSCSNHIIIGLFVGLDLHQTHFFQHFRYFVYFLLVPQQVHQKVEVLQSVRSLEEERFEVRINFFIYFRVVVFLNTFFFTA